MFIIADLELSKMKLVLDQLAKLHAASHHHIHTYPGGGLVAFREKFSVFFHDSWNGTNEQSVQFLHTVITATYELIQGRDSPKLLNVTVWQLLN
jgi:hypothetical protein